MISVLINDKSRVSFNTDVDKVLNIIQCKYENKHWVEKLEQQEQLISRIRQEKDKEARRGLKAQLQAVTFNGCFNPVRRKAFLQKTSGFIYLDYDSVNPDFIKDELSKQPACMACFTSPSGNGCSALIAVNGLTADNFTHNAVRVQQLFNYDGLDVGCKDVTRLTYITRDKSAVIKTAKPLTAEQPPVLEYSIPVVLDTADSLLHAEYSAIKKHGNITVGNRNNFLMTFLGVCKAKGLSQYEAESYASKFGVPSREVNYKAEYVWRNYR